MKWVQHIPRILALAAIAALGLSAAAPLIAAPAGYTAVTAAPGVYILPTTPAYQTMALQPLVSIQAEPTPTEAPAEPVFVVAMPTQVPQVIYIEVPVYQEPAPQSFQVTNVEPQANLNEGVKVNRKSYR